MTPRAGGDGSAPKEPAVAGAAAESAGGEAIGGGAGATGSGAGAGGGGEGSSGAPSSGRSGKSKGALSPEDVPSSAVFVKNLETNISGDQLKDVFEQFVDDNDRSKLLIAEGHIDRGFAFVDLGSQAAVARAVSASRAEGIKMGEKKLVVEPSKKPVRPSGLKAMNERRGPTPPYGGKNSSSSAGGRGGVGRGSGGADGKNGKGGK